MKQRKYLAASGGRAFVGPLLAFLFLGLLAVLVFAGRLPAKLFSFYAVASLLAFVVYAWDKSAAQGNRWRTRESTLHLIALLGGWPGALLAQRLLRHKSTKRSFLVVFWVTVLVNCGVLGWVVMGRGGWARQLFG